MIEDRINAYMERVYISFTKELFSWYSSDCKFKVDHDAFARIKGNPASKFAINKPMRQTLDEMTAFSLHS